MSRLLKQSCKCTRLRILLNVEFICSGFYEISLIRMLSIRGPPYQFLSATILGRPQICNPGPLKFLQLIRKVFKKKPMTRLQSKVLPTNCEGRYKKYNGKNYKYAPIKPKDERRVYIKMELIDIKEGQLTIENLQLQKDFFDICPKFRRFFLSLSLHRLFLISQVANNKVGVEGQIIPFDCSESYTLFFNE